MNSMLPAAAQTSTVFDSPVPFFYNLYGKRSFKFSGTALVRRKLYYLCVSADFDAFLERCLRVVFLLFLQLSLC